MTNTLARIKWRWLREKKEEMISLLRLPIIVNVEETWNHVKDTIYKAAYATGVTKRGKQFNNRDTAMNSKIIMKTSEKSPKKGMEKTPFPI